MSFKVTDVIAAPSNDDAAWLNDRHTLVTRAARARWGRAMIAREDGRSTSTLELASGARVVIGLLTRSVPATLHTPSFADVMRAEGE